jgi:uncharacterized Zn finger protein (UPF0148 family)
MCKYFRNAVLPTDKVLEAILSGRVPATAEKCAVCGSPFFPESKQYYCSPACQHEGNKRKSRERMRKKRKKD